MEVFFTVVHILIAVVLITLVLVQDPKGGAMSGAFGGGAGSNSVLGPMGAATLAQKLTRWIAALFALSCIGLTIMFGGKNAGVGIENTVISAQPTTSSEPIDKPAAATTPPSAETSTTTPPAQQPSK